MNCLQCRTMLEFLEEQQARLEEKISYLAAGRAIDMAGEVDPYWYKQFYEALWKIYMRAN